MFLQYHDVFKPIYLYATLSLLLQQRKIVLPVDILSKLSALGLVEWYWKRRYINPLRCIDFNGLYSPDELDDFMAEYLSNDHTIYELSPALSVAPMLKVYIRDGMKVPVYVYSEHEEEAIPEDLKRCYPTIDIQYVYGDFINAVKPCLDNFTFILSDIHYAKQLVDEYSENLCADVLVCREYRYNYTDNCTTPKVDMEALARTSPVIRIGWTQSVRMIELAKDIVDTFGIDKKDSSEEGYAADQGTQTS